MIDPDNALAATGKHMPSESPWSCQQCWLDSATWAQCRMPKENKCVLCHICGEHVRLECGCRLLACFGSMKGRNKFQKLRCTLMHVFPALDARVRLVGTGLVHFVTSSTSSLAVF